jgi:hypothetical protein
MEIIDKTEKKGEKKSNAGKASTPRSHFYGFGL